MAGDEACPHVTMRIHQEIQLRLEAILSWIQEDTRTASQIIFTMSSLPPFPGAISGCFVLLCFVLVGGGSSNEKEMQR